jgi:hypothetical protein
MYDSRITDFPESAYTVPPDIGFAFRPIGPEGLFDRYTLRFESKTDEVIEVAVGDTLDIHKNGRTLDGQRWGTDDVGASLLDGKRL